jgi:hypothetical protein
VAPLDAADLVGDAVELGERRHQRVVEGERAVVALRVGGQRRHQSGGAARVERGEQSAPD